MNAPELMQEVWASPPAFPENPIAFLSSPGFLALPLERQTLFWACLRYGGPPWWLLPNQIEELAYEFRSLFPLDIRHFPGVITGWSEETLHGFGTAEAATEGWSYRIPVLPSDEEITPEESQLSRLKWRYKKALGQLADAETRADKHAIIGLSQKCGRLRKEIETNQRAIIAALSSVYSLQLKAAKECLCDVPIQ